MRKEEGVFCKVDNITDDRIINGPTNHAHRPDPAKIQAERTIHAIRLRAETLDEPTSSIIQHCVYDYPLAATGALPKRETLAPMIRRKRAAPDGIEIPDELHRTTRGEHFLAHHDEEQDIR